MGVTDSDPDSCQWMNRVTQRMGHNAIAMGTLVHGLETACTHQVNVVIMNARPPAGGGPAALAERITLPSHPENIITDSIDQNGAELAMTSGAWDYIEKGVSVSRCPWYQLCFRNHCLNAFSTFVKSH